MLRKSQDGDTDEFIIFRALKCRFCVPTMSNIMIILYVEWCDGIACDWCATLDIA